MSLAQLLRGDTVTLTPYLGEGAGGPVFGPVRQVLCRAEFTRQLVRNARGDEVVSEATLYVNAADGVAFLPESRVTVNGQRDSEVINVSPHKGYGRQVVYVEVILK